MIQSLNPKEIPSDAQNELLRKEKSMMWGTRKKKYEDSESQSFAYSPAAPERSLSLDLSKRRTF
jgi:hypothetical protein